MHAANATAPTFVAAIFNIIARSTRRPTHIQISCTIACVPHYMSFCEPLLTPGHILAPMWAPSPA